MGLILVMSRFSVYTSVMFVVLLWKFLKNTYTQKKYNYNLKLFYEQNTRYSNYIYNTLG